MAGSLDTISKVRALFAATDLNVLRLSLLLQRFGLTGVSDASLTRALQRNKFSNEIDMQVRPFVLRIESLLAAIEPLKFSFSDLEYAVLVLRLLEDKDVHVRFTDKHDDLPTAQ